MQMALEASPLHFGYSDGLVTDVCIGSGTNEVDNEWTLNVKKAVVSALQMTSSSLTREQRVRETDLQGACVTHYQPISERFGKHVIRRTKNFAECEERQQWFNGMFPKAYAHYQSLPLTSGQQECVQSIESDIVFGVTCEERQHVFGKRYEVKSKMNLRFERQSESSVSGYSNLRRHYNHLKMSQNYIEGEEGNGNGQQLEPILRQLCQQMSQKSEKSSQQFSRLVSRLRKSSEQEIDSIYEKIQEICPQEKSILDLFLDANSHSGSYGSIKVIQKWIKKSQNNGLRSQLIAHNLAFVSQPSIQALPVLNEILSEHSQQSHWLLGVSAYFHNTKHSQQQSQDYRREEKKLVQELVKKLNSNQYSQQIIAIKALQNIGLEAEPEARQRLVELAQQKQLNSGLRVASLKALSEAMNGQQERPLVVNIVQDSANSNEVRVNALKALVMSGSSAQEMEQLRQLVDSSGNENLRQYARSLIENLQETSDPHKRDIVRRIQTGSGQKWTKAENKYFGISNNFETSFMLDALGLGAVVESDVIYEESRSLAPSSVLLNVTLPLLGREVNVIEMEFRQKGFDSILEQKVRDIYRQLKSETKNSRQFVDSLLSLLSSNDWKREIHSNQAFIELSLKVDGKTIFVYNSHYNHNSVLNIRQIYQQFVQQREGFAFAFQPINTRLQIPSGNGWPIIARINSTILAQLRPKPDVISPQFVWQTEAGIQLLAQNQKREVGVAFNVQSAPEWQSSVDYNGNGVQIKFSLPEERITLLKSGAEVRMNGGSEGVWSGSGYQKCTEWTKKAFGMQFCFAKNSKEFEFYLQKTERIQTIVMKAETGSQGFRVEFNTPESQQDRHLEFQVQRDGQQGVKMSLRSPWTRVTGSGQLRADEKEHSLTVDLQQNEQKLLEMSIGLEEVLRGQKREFRPRVQLTWRARDLIRVGGTVSVAKGRKNQLMINLEGNQKQFLKGSLVREGDRKSADIRISSDLSLHLLNGLEVKINSLLDKSPKHVTADLQLEYRTQKSSRKESLKTSIKLQSLGQSTATAHKLSAFGELTSTQFPEYNCHVAYNVLNKPSEHVENELTVQWNQQLSEKVHILQVTKLTGSDQMETTVNVEVTPLKVDYELRAHAQQQSQQITAQVSGKDRSGKSSGQDFKANFQFKHVSRAPLHLTLSADLKTASSEWKYSDELRETQGNGNEFKGQTAIQWSQNGSPLKMAKMEYEYKKKAGVDHQMDLQITSPLTQKPIKHSALLRMSRRDWHLKSRLSIGDQLSHHFEAELSREGAQSVHAQYGGYLAKGHAHMYQLPQRAEVEFQTPNSHVIHKTNVEIVPKNSFHLKSDTKRGNSNIFALESDISRSKPSKVIFSSKQVEGKVDFRSGNGEHSAQWNVNHLANDWTHSSAVKVIPQQKTIEIQSKTVRKSEPLMILDSIYNQKQQKLNFLLPSKKTSVLIDATSGRHPRSAKVEVNCGPNFRHISQYESEEPEVHRFESTQTDFRSAQPLYRLQYQQNRDGHQFNGHYLQNYVVEGEYKPWNQFSSGQGSVSVNLKNKRSQLEHNSKIAFDNRIVKIESQTRNSNQNLAEIDGQLNRINGHEESHLKIKLPRAQTRAHLFVTPSSGAKWQYSAPNADHVTSLEWAESASGHPHYACDSKTTLDNHVTYALAGSHSPDRKSFISVKTPDYDVSGHVDRARDTPSAKLSVITPRTSHVTEVSANRNRKSIRVESRSDRKSGPEAIAESIYNFDGNYNHLNEEIPSNFGLKLGKNQLKINGKVQPFGQNRFLSVSAESPQYSHVTELTYGQPSSGHLVIKSQTSGQNGANLAKIESIVPFKNLRGEKSHVTVLSPRVDTSLQFSPEERSLLFRYSDPKWSHETRYQSRKDYLVDSETKFQGSPYFQFKTQLNSQLNDGKLVIKTPRYGHQTQLVKNGNHFVLNSNTDYENQSINKFSLDSNKHLELEIPQHFTTSGQWSRDGVQVDYRSRMPTGRHVLASVRMPRDQNQFGVDIAWDQQRDPNQRVKLEWEQKSGRQDSARAIHVLRVGYAGNEVRVESDVTKRSPFQGPNQWSVKYSPKYNAEKDSLELRINHVIINGNEMNCHLSYFEGEKQKLDSKLVTKWEKLGNGNGIELEFESNSASNPDLNLKLDFKTRVEDLKTRNANIMTAIKVLIQNTKQYALEWHVARAQQQSSNGDVIKGEMIVETPSGGRQEMDFRLNVGRQEVQFAAKAKDRKLLEISARADSERAQEKHVQFEMKSNIRDIPSVSVSGDYFRSKQISLKAEVDGERKAEVSVIRTGNDYHSGSQVSARIETPFWPKFESLLSLKKNSEEIDFEFNAKVDSKEVISALIKGKRTASGVWTGQARVSDNGSQLAQLEAETTSGPSADQFRYSVTGNSRRNRFFSPLRVLFTIEKNRKSGNRVKVNACEETGNTCFDVNGLWKEGSERLPERVELSLQKNGKSFEFKTSFDETVEDHSSGQSLFGLTSGRVQEKTRNEAFLAVNGHQMGFELLSTKRNGNKGRESVLRLEFPNRKEFQVKSDFFQQTHNHWTGKSQLVDNSKQEVILETEMEATNSDNEFRFRLEAKSERIFRSKAKRVEFWFQKPSQEVDFRSKIEIQLNENPITVETIVERKPIQQKYLVRGQQRKSYFGSSSSLNNTLVLRISDKKKIDFEFSAHASQLTAGFLIKNKNRRGEKRFVHLFAETEASSGDENRFHAIYSTNQQRYRVEGAWLGNNEVNYQLIDEKNSQNQRISVRIALKAKCLEYELQRGGTGSGEKRKYQLCANYDQKEDKSLQLSLEELSSGGKSRQLTGNVELVDQRGGEESVKIDVTWTPQLLQEWSEAVRQWYQNGNGNSNYNNYLLELIEDFSEELYEKSSQIYQLLNEELFRPLSQQFSDEFQDLVQEFGKLFGNGFLERVFQIQQQLSDALYRHWQSITQHVSHFQYSLQSLDTWWRPVTRVARKQCQKYEICYKFLYGVEKYGFGAIYDYFQWNSMRLLRESHRLIVATSGRIFYSFPVPNWLRDYHEELYGFWQSIIASNPTLQSIVDTIEQLVREVTKDWEQINGPEVKRSAQKLAGIVFDVSAQRVLVWDPVRGRFSLQIKSNTQGLRRQLRSVKPKMIITSGQWKNKMSEFLL